MAYPGFTRNEPRLDIVSMLLTQAQVRQLVVISEETFRTWREVFPMLRRPKGRPSFTMGDVVGLRIVRDMVNQLGVKVGTIGPFGPSLFDLCEQAIDVPAPAEHLLFSQNGFEAVSGQLDLLEFEQPLILIPLRATVVSLRSKLIAEAHEQASLPFPAPAFG